MRSSALARKRAEYASLVDVTFSKGRNGLDQQIWHQIEIDVPRTRPGVELWMHEATQRVRSNSCRNSTCFDYPTEYRKDIIRLGDPASRERIRSRDQ